MIPLAQLPDAVARRIEVVFTDIDDTLTEDGQLGPEAYAALWALKRNGFRVVPVTGRPAGWCDMIARFWPVDGVVGENGAFYYAYDRKAQRMNSAYVLDAAARAQLQTRLASVGNKILASVPRAQISADQAFRIHDLAIDFAEDVQPALSASEISQIVQGFEAAGATAKVSSIHVNGWFGDYDKLSMIRRWVADQGYGPFEATEDRFVYAGDSPNDCPAFGAFSHSVGVQNVAAFEKDLDPPPVYITEGHGGIGFAQLVEQLLRARAQTPSALS